MLVNIMNWSGKTSTLGIDINDVDHIDVAVVTGDELMAIYGHDGKLIQYVDSADLFGDPRLKDYFDGHYTVNKEDLEEWLDRDAPESWRGIIFDEDMGNVLPLTMKEWASFVKGCGSV